MAEIIILDNGLKLIYEKIDRVKSVAIGIFIENGSKYENDDNLGISHFIEHMLFKGTINRNSQEILEEIDFVGGSINASTSTEYTAYTCKMLGEHIEVGIDILSDMYINSVFSDVEIEKEKKVVLEEILMYEDLPEEKIHDLNNELVLKGSKHANPVLGTVETVNSFNHNTLQEFFDKRYGTDNSYISIAGNVEREKLIEVIEKKFGKVRSKKIITNYRKNFIINKVDFEKYKDTTQTHLCVNGKGISSIDDNRYSLMLLSLILGGNMSSRLFQKIREEKGLAYSVYTYLSSYMEGGIISAYAATTPENKKIVADLILDEFKLITTDGITRKELEKTKNQILSDITISLESSGSVMVKNAMSYIRNGYCVTIDEKIAKIKSVGILDVLNIAREAFSNEYISTVKYGKI